MQVVKIKKARSKTGLVNPKATLRLECVLNLGSKPQSMGPCAVVVIVAWHEVLDQEVAR